MLQQVDFSGDVDIDGTLEADAITVNGYSFSKCYCRNYSKLGDPSINSYDY